MQSCRGSCCVSHLDRSKISVFSCTLMVKWPGCLREDLRAPGDTGWFDSNLAENGIVDSYE